MLKITLKRVFKSGYNSFRRNGWLTTATVMVMVLVLLVLGGLVFLGAMANSLLATFEEKIDVTVYFLPDSPEESILQAKREIEALAEVEQVSYVSREAALDKFRDKHQNNALIVEALNELGENPLEASLNVRAKDPTQYATVSDFLLQKNYPIVDKINYFENQGIIERLGSIVSTVRGSGALLALVLAFISILVAFNTIRLAIYTMREEIRIMRLVGATQWFIRGPFLVEGILYGISAAVIATLVFFPITWASAPKIGVLIPNFNLFGYFTGNFLQFFVIMIVTGIGLGTISSFIAMRRYLQV